MLKNNLVHVNNKLECLDDNYKYCMFLINRDLSKMIDSYALSSDEEYYKCFCEHLEWVYKIATWNSISIDLGRRVLTFMESLLNQGYSNKEIAERIFDKFDIKFMKMNLNETKFIERHIS